MLYEHTPKPHWLWEKYLADMRVHDHVKTTAAFVGIQNDRGQFIPYGTGFCCLWIVQGLGMPYVVTARHVIDDIAGDTVWVRIGKKDGGFYLISLPKEEFITHPKHNPGRKYIDATACVLPEVMPEDPIAWLRPEDFITPEDIAGHNFGVGDEVTIMGILMRHFGETKNLPIVRIGNIAAMPDEPVPTDFGFMEAYLIEVRSIDGLSGSPVMLNSGLRPPMEKSAPLGSLKRYYFLGMMLGHYAVKNPRDIIDARQETEDPIPLGELNTGISVVLPSERIVEMLDSPQEIDRRNEWAKTQLAATGYRAD